MDDFIPAEHRIFLTEEDDSIGINGGSGQGVSSDEITVNIGLNGDCYIEDDYLAEDFISDDSLTESTDEEEYDTDLEVNEEGMLHNGFE